MCSECPTRSAASRPPSARGQRKAYESKYPANTLDSFDQPERRGTGVLIGAGRPNGSRPRLRSCPRVMRDTGPARPPCAGRRLPQASGLRGRRGPTRLDERGLAAPTLGCRPSAPSKPTQPRDVLSERSLVIHENQQQIERILDRPWLGLAGTGGSVGFLEIFIGDGVRFCGSAQSGGRHNRRFGALRYHRS